MRDLDLFQRTVKRDRKIEILIAKLANELIFATYLKETKLI